MTEDEAKTKWCPMGQYGIAVGPDGDVAEINNRPFSSGKPTCIGSACMMWRQTRKGHVMADGRVVQEPNGYCGLAGRSS